MNEPGHPDLLSVVVPTYNEERHIEGNLNMLFTELETIGLFYEVIVVNDGSSDSTQLKLAAYEHPHLRIISLDSNRGKGYAVRKGMGAARGNLLLFIDGGMELHPKEIRVFIGLMDLYEADVVVGSKRHPQSRVFYPWYRRVLSYIFQKVLKYLFKLDVTDTQVGIKLFRREVIASIMPELTTDRYGFDLEMLLLARAHGYSKMLEAPIRLDYFGKGTHFVSDIGHVLKIGLHILTDVFAIYRKTKKRDAPDKKTEVPTETTH